MSEPTGEPIRNEHRNAKAEAKAAKAYAKATRPWYKKKRWWLAGLVLVIIIGSVASSGSDDPTAPPTASEPTATDEPTESEAPTESEEPTEEPTAPEEPSAPEPEPEAVPVRAGVILKEFEDNELAADNKYKGKALKITGVVDSIDTDLFDDEKYILRISSGARFAFLTVNCNEMSTDELATLKKGDNVTVLGEFDDGGDLGVEVKDCRLA